MLATVKTKIGIPRIVGDDQDDIWFARGTAIRFCHRCCTAKLFYKPLSYFLVELIEPNLEGINSVDPLCLITADVRDTISCAAWQNSVPLIDSIKIKNDSPDPINDVHLTLTSSSRFLKPKTWKINQLLAGDEFQLADFQIGLNPEFLGGLNEAEKSQLNFELTADGKMLASAKSTVRVLARNEWGGLNQDGELIAAFVMPNAPAIAKILKSAAAILEKHGQPSRLDGYQSNDPKRAYLLTMAIWNAICGLKLTYANPTKSFETMDKKTRMPQTVVDPGLATCLDSTLLFSSAIEAVGLNPVIVMTEGHCFAGVWLSQQTFNQVVERESSEVRKALAANELVTFETTLVTQVPPVQFQHAVTTAKAATAETKERDFVASFLPIN